jgi:tetratricopeptide (TPR) repeat protein
MNTMRLARLIITGLLTLTMLASASAFAASADDLTDAERLELAARLTADGEYDRAARAWAKIDAAAEELDLAKYYTVAGLIALNQSRNDDAARNLQSAIEHGQTDPTVHLYLAQAQFGLERYREALRALDAAGETGAQLGTVWNMRAHAHWMLGERQRALDMLGLASARFPANNTFLRRQVFYLIELGLYQEAASLAQHFLERSDAKAEDYAALGSALRRSQRYAQALPILEAAHLRFPDHDAITKTLAQTHLEAGHPLAAARLLEPLTLRDPALLVEVAELYRRAGHTTHALSLNARVPEQTKKLKQRVGLLVEAKRYAEVAGMEATLARNGLLADEDLRYALAYANFRINNLDAAERHLAALKRADLFRKATELRRIMAECADAMWSCS